MNLDSQIGIVQNNTLKMLRLQIEQSFWKERVNHYKQLLLNWKPSVIKQENIKNNDFQEQIKNQITQQFESQNIHEKNQINKKYECRGCKKQYKSNNALVYHLKKVHENHGINQFIRK
ncbi:hypothetical protein pb186bvf_000703 [Paramecium bursaria]